MVDRDALVISGDGVPDWRPSRARNLARAVAHELVDLDVHEIIWSSMEADRAGRYVIKMTAVEADGAAISVDNRVG